MSSAPSFLPRRFATTQAKRTRLKPFRHDPNRKHYQKKQGGQRSKKRRMLNPRWLGSA